MVYGPKQFQPDFVFFLPDDKAGEVNVIGAVHR